MLSSTVGFPPLPLSGRTESGGIVLAANAGPRVPSGGVTLKRRCTYRPSVIYLFVNKPLSLSPPPPHPPSPLPTHPRISGGACRWGGNDSGNISLSEKGSITLKTLGVDSCPKPRILNFRDSKHSVLRSRCGYDLLAASTWRTCMCQLTLTTAS